MFNFTTTTLINTQQDLTTGLPLWSLQKKTLANGEETTTLNIKRLHNFNKNNVVAIYKAEGNRAQLAKVCIDLADIEVGETYRFLIYVGLTQASQNARYSNDMIYKGLPFSIDFKCEKDAPSTIEKLAKNIKKYSLTTYGEKLFDIKLQNGTELVISAYDEFQRFRKVNLELLDREANHHMGEYNVIKSLEDLTEVDDPNNIATDTYFVGKEAFADYNYITRNLRLPTPSRTYAFATLQEENPIPGALYNQYTIHYCSKRGQLGLNAVGDVVKSVTTHVLFINQDLLDKIPDGDLPEDSDDISWEKADIEAALAAIAPEEGIVKVPND